MEQLDQSVVNLAKSIRKAESNDNFTARSKDGSFGAYQFIKPTWDSTAKKYGVKAEWDKATPEQQNEVAYKQLKEWKDKGFNPGQIASMWNAGAGEPDAYKGTFKSGKPATGKNSYGVKYDVPGYAQKVAAYYKDLKLGTQEVAPEQSKVKGGFIGNLLTGSTQRFGQTIGESLAAGKNTELYSKVLEQNTEIRNNLITRIEENKKLGKDTTKLAEALYQLDKDTPQQEQFTGNVVNKTAGQVVGEGIGTGLEALSGGLLSSGAKTVVSKTLTTGQKIAQGAGLGATYGAIGGGSSALQEGGGVDDTLKGTAFGGIIGGALGGGLSAIGSRLATRKAPDLTQKSSITGQILQGTPDDILRSQKVLTNPKLNKAKTYAEGANVLDDEVRALSNKQDKLLGNDTTVRKLKDLKATLQAGDKEIKHNFVNDALEQLTKFFEKTNDRINLTKIKQLKLKANKSGLTVKEINDIAKLHGERLNAFNASGELASGLSKQAAENTRAGLKTTVRELFGGKTSKAIDKEISDTIRVRDLFNKMVEKVNTLQQRIQERSLGAKAGYLVGKVINTIGLGSPKGIVEAIIPRGQGFKLLNALDLEKNLQKNIKLLQELADTSIPEKTLIEKMEAFINKTPQLSLTQKPAQSIIKNNISQNIPKTIPKLKPKVKPSLDLKSPKVNRETPKTKSAFKPGGNEVPISSIEAREVSSPTRVATAKERIAKAEAGTGSAREPILVDINNKVISGNTTLQALKEMGYKKISVQRYDALEKFTQREGLKYEKIVGEVESALKKAPEAKEYLTTATEEIVKGIDDVKTVPVDIKRFPRILEKTITEEGGDVSKLTDLVRDTIIPLNKESSASVIKRMTARGDIVTHRLQTPDKFMGYEGNMFKIKTKGGLVIETQVISPEMVYGKSTVADAKEWLGEKLFNQIKTKYKVEAGRGHLLYERFRSLTTEQKEGRIGQDLVKQSKEYYDIFRR